MTANNDSLYFLYVYIDICVYIHIVPIAILGLGQLEADSSQTQRQVCRRCVASPRFCQPCIQRKTLHTRALLLLRFKNAFSDIT